MSTSRCSQPDLCYMWTEHLCHKTNTSCTTGDISYICNALYMARKAAGLHLIHSCIHRCTKSLHWRHHTHCRGLPACLPVGGQSVSLSCLLLWLQRLSLAVHQSGWTGDQCKQAAHGLGAIVLADLSAHVPQPSSHDSVGSLALASGLKLHSMAHDHGC